MQTSLINCSLKTTDDNLAWSNAVLILFLLANPCGFAFYYIF